MWVLSKGKGGSNVKVVKQDCKYKIPLQNIVCSGGKETPLSVKGKAQDVESFMKYIRVEMSQSRVSYKGLELNPNDF